MHAEIFSRPEVANPRGFCGKIEAQTACSFAQAPSLAKTQSGPTCSGCKDEGDGDVGLLLPFGEPSIAMISGGHLEN
jgi:hypothetical protein